MRQSALREAKEAGDTPPVLVPQAALSWQDRVGFSGLMVLLLLLSVRYTTQVLPRTMEFDQICTLITAGVSSWHAYLAAVPVDAQPPFSHLAARIGLLLPLPQSIGVHLFSALSVVLAVVCIFRLFQRRGAPLAGLCAASLFAASRSTEFMYTVRPYAALMAVTALGLLVYDTYRERRTAQRRPPVWPLVTVLVLAATIHALSLLYVSLPIVAGEVLFWWRTRRLDRRILLAFALASPAFAFDLAFTRLVATRYMGQVPVSAKTPGLPTTAKLLEALSYPVERRWEVLLFAAVLAITLVLWRRDWSTSGTAAQNAPDLLYLLLAAGAIYAGAILAYGVGFLNQYFYPRYASPVFVSGALVLGVLLSTAPWRRFALVPVGIVVVLVCLPVPALRTVLRTESHHAPRSDFEQAFQHGDLVVSPLAAPTVWWYATPEERRHLRVVTDEMHYRALPDGIPEATLLRYASVGVLPFPLTPYRNFEPGSDVYLLRPNTSGDSWLPAALADRGFACETDMAFQSESYTLVHCARQVSDSL